jgi:hypothetical protein
MTSISASDAWRSATCQTLLSNALHRSKLPIEGKISNINNKLANRYVKCGLFDSALQFATPMLAPRQLFLQSFAPYGNSALES